ncbi:MAG: hypothetical protein BWY59_01978 [Verrucomicrobia bacterium ADurb.Bin345]|nr:MAG: hypothetical protein BWY59_01978 [Verrucomicrobia bacterium ADurb.Bin345]
MTNMRLAGLGLLIASAACLCGCTVARMAVDPSLAGGAQELPVQGRQGFVWNKPLEFGGFKVTDIDRGWLKRMKWDVFGLTGEKARQSYEFKIASGNGPAWQAKCATGINRKDLELDNFLNTGGSLKVELESDVLFACTFTAPRGEWKLIMSQGTRQVVLNGILTDGSKQLLVEGTRELAGGAWPMMEPTGYHFLLNGRFVGAVEVLNAGAVWLDGSLDENTRMAVASASSALLLYREIHEQ